MRALGLDLVGCPVDDDGALPPAVRADAIVATPAHQFPTGAVLSGARRRALLAWAAGCDALVIEDDYDAEFRYDRDGVRALQGLDPERVAYLGTTSKTLAPGLRLGWLVVPDVLADAALRTKRLLDVGSPSLDQLALARLLRSGDLDRHVRRARAAYGARRDALLAALARELPGCPVSGIAAGLHVVLGLPAGQDDARVAAAALERGVLVAPLSRYRIAPSPAGGLVLGFGRCHVDAVAPAVRLVAEAIRAAAARTP
ncbi:MAG: PLP-dependent aminotransferase family protein [Thermoleophilia bacterium]